MPVRFFAIVASVIGRPAVAVDGKSRRGASNHCVGALTLADQGGAVQVGKHAAADNSRYSGIGR